MWIWFQSKWDLIYFCFLTQEFHSIKADVWHTHCQPRHSPLRQGRRGRRRTGGKLPKFHQRSRRMFSFMASCGNLLYSPHHRHGLHSRICPRWVSVPGQKETCLARIYFSLQPRVSGPLGHRDRRGLRRGGHQPQWQQCPGWRYTWQD